MHAPVKYQPEKAAAFAEACPVPVTADWLAGRSPVPLAADHEEAVELFLSTLYPGAGDRVLLLEDLKSPGDFLWNRGAAVRLSHEPGVDPVPSKLPRGGSGLWALVNPVTGDWEVGRIGRFDDGTRSRRSKMAVRDWRYLLVQPVGDADPATWLRCMARLPVAVAAILEDRKGTFRFVLRLDAGAKSRFDLFRPAVLLSLGDFGADDARSGGLSCVLLPCPGSRLIWLDGDPSGLPIADSL